MRLEAFRQGFVEESGANDGRDDLMKVRKAFKRVGQVCSSMSASSVIIRSRIVLCAASETLKEVMTELMPGGQRFN